MNRVYAVESNLGDYYDTWRVDYLYTTLELAEEAMRKLEIINKGIDYRITRWHVRQTAIIEGK